MRNLLTANFFRLRKSLLFWGTALLSFGMGCAITANQIHEQMKFGFMDSPSFSRYALLIGVVIAVFVSLFFGTEYSDGTIRNKIAAGQPRMFIYLANLITATVCGMLFFALYVAACLAVSMPFINSGAFAFVSVSPAVFAMVVSGTLALTAAYSALFLLLTMNTGHKATASAVCILASFALLAAGIYLEGRLNASPFISNYMFSVDGEVTESEPEPNPRYLEGTKREVYQFLYDFLPGGQSIQYGAANVGKPGLLPVYSLSLAVMTAVGGALRFRRKDLK